ncbi:MAG: hypothetical protein HRF49_03220 [bacterium]|jgi:hypothetical protein
MGSAHVKILNLLKDGKISVEEAERLLKLVNEDPSPDAAGAGEFREFIRELPDAVVRNMKDVYGALSEAAKAAGVKGKVIFAKGKDKVVSAYSSEKNFRVKLPEGLAEARVIVSAKVGAVKIRGAHDAPDLLASGTRRGVAPDGISFHADADDASKGTLLLETEAGTLDCTLHPGALYDVEVDTGAGAVKLDLRDIRVRSLVIENSLGGVSAKLGSLVPEVAVSVSNNAGKVKLAIPEGAGIRAEADGDMGVHNLDDAGLVRDGAAYVSDGYTNAAVKFALTIEQTVGAFKLKRG